MDSCMDDKRPSISEFVAGLESKKIKLWIEAGGLKYKAPASMVTKEMLERLRERKEEIIAYLQSRESDLLFKLPIPKAEEREYYPMSPAQLRMFLLNQMDNKSTAYNLTQVFMVNRDIDRERLENTVRQLIARHESLRTSFRMVEGKPVQKILSSVEFNLEYQELDGTEEDLAQVIKNFIRSYDLAQPPLLRFKYVKLRDRQGSLSCYLIQDMHHIISDGISEAILSKEFNELYAGKSLPELKIQYKDYTLWQEKLLAGDDIAKQKQYWLEQLRGELPALELPCDYPRPPEFSNEGDTVRLHIDPELTGRLHKLARENRVTLFAVLLATCNVLLAKYTGQNDIIVGTPVAGRRHADTHGIIGVLVNTLAIRNAPLPEKSFDFFLKEVGEQTIKAFDNQDYPFDWLVEDLNVPRDLSRNPIFSTMFILQNMNIDEIQVENLEISRVNYDRKMAQFDVSITAAEDKNGISLEFNYYACLFQKDTMERFARHYANLLQVISENPTYKLSDIEMLSDEEKRQLLYDFNHTKVSYPKDRTIHQLFEEQVERTPDHIAVVFEDQQLTYRELNEKSNRLARVLRAKGVKPDEVVAIMVKRSPEMIMGILGILKAGGAYLPIDPEYPKDRIGYMLEDSEARVLLVDSVQRTMDIEKKIKIINLKEESSYQADSSNLECVNKSNDLAYVIYTSGSTGKPKGIMIEHRTVHNFITGVCEKIAFETGKAILCLTTMSFDIFVLETLLPLAKGLKVVLAGEAYQHDPRRLCGLIKSSGVDMLQMTPSRLRMILSADNELSCCENIREVMVGGEALPEDLLAELNKLKATRIFNMYGPTETTVWSTIKELSGLNRITIGKPIANTKVYILDKRGKMQPVGIAGELCIAGDGLARGYLHRPELTAEKFVPNPFASTDSTNELSSVNCKLSTDSMGRMYRTGDLARWLPDGDIEYLGRLDFQVKIRGYRIELGEIEAQLAKHPAIREAAVIDKEDINKSKYLCGYYVCDETLTAEGLREYLSEKLPDYMIPSYFIPMEKLPLTPNGKLDRKALPEPDGSINTGVDYVAPESETERKLAAIWQDILGIKRVGVIDNFFELGGHSLKAVSIVECAQKEGVNISVPDIFRYRTIRRILENTVVTESGVETECVLLQENGIENRNILPYKHQNNISIYLFRSLPAGIILAHDNLLPWYYQHFMLLCSQIGDDGRIKMDYAENKETFKEIIQYTMLGYCDFEDITDIVSYVKERIDAKQYVIIFMDEYYLTAKSHYQQEHFVHESMIYGYDDAKKVFIGCGFNRQFMMDQLVFTYDEASMAFEMGKVHYMETASYAESQAVQLLSVIEREDAYSFDMDIFIGEIRDHLFSAGNLARVSIVVLIYDRLEYGQIVNFIPKGHLKFGIAVYEDVLYGLEKILEGDVQIDHLLFHLLAEHKKGIRERLVYIAKKYPSNSSIPILIEEYGQVVELAEKIRLKALEFMYADQVSYEDAERGIRQIMDDVKRLKENEERQLSKILEHLEYYRRFRSFDM